MYVISKSRPLSTIAREAAAVANREAKAAYDQDDMVKAVRRVRTAMTDLDMIREEARRRHAAENAPIVLPDNVRASSFHPQKAAAIAALSANWSSDPREPIEATRSVDEIAGELAIMARAELQAANDAIRALDAQRRAETLGPDA